MPNNLIDYTFSAVCLVIALACASFVLIVLGLAALIGQRPCRISPHPYDPLALYLLLILTATFSIGLALISLFAPTH